MDGVVPEDLGRVVLYEYQKQIRALGKPKAVASDQRRRAPVMY